MKTSTLITVLFAMALLVTPLIALGQGQGQGQGQRYGADKPPPQERAQVERGQRDMGSDRLRQQDRLGTAEHDRDRIQDRTHAPDDARQQQNNIYGYDLMTEQERTEHQQPMRSMTTEQERAAYRARHHEEMQRRAREQGVAIPDQVPEQRKGRGPGSEKGKG